MFVDANVCVSTNNNILIACLLFYVPLRPLNRKLFYEAGYLNNSSQ